MNSTLPSKMEVSKAPPRGIPSRQPPSTWSGQHSPTPLHWGHLLEGCASEGLRIKSNYRTDTGQSVN